MPDYSFTSPEGKSYTITGPEGSTREQAFQLLPVKYPELQGQPGFEGGAATTQTAAPVPAPSASAAQQQGGTLSQLGRQLGLGARYSLEAFTLPVTGTYDAIAMAANAVARGAGLQKQLPMAGDAFSQGLTELGFPEAQTAREKTVQTIAEVAPAVAAGGALGGKAAIPAAKKLVSTYRGQVAKARSEEAAKAITKVSAQAQKEAELSALKQQQIAQREAQKAESAAVQRQKVEKALATPPKTTSLHETGTVLRGAISDAMGQAAAYRAAEGEKLFKSAQEAAKVKAAAGQFIDTSAALKPVEELLSHVRGVPGLEEKVTSMTRMLQAAHPEQKKATILFDRHGEPLVTGAPDTTPMTFEHAEVIRRYLNDIAYSADMEGYPGIARRAAKEAVQGLDKAMGEYVPEFKQYKEGWAQLSKPLESMGTKLGRAVFGAEGGIKDEAYAKVAAQDLPGKFFANREGVDTLVDALAGGKGADAVARAHAEKLAQGMALKYFEEKARLMGAEAMQKFVQAPAQRGALEAMPKVQSALERQATLGVGRTAKVELLKSAESAAARRSEEAAKAAREFRQTISNLREQVFKADTLAMQQSVAFQSQALTGYKKALEGARKVGAVSDTDFQAMMAMLDRAKTAQEKMQFLRHTVKTALWVTVGVGAGAETVLHKMAQ